MARPGPELLQEILPKLARVAVLETSTNPGNVPAFKGTELAAGGFNVQLQFFDVLNFKDIETAFRNASKGHAEAVLVLFGAAGFAKTLSSTCGEHYRFPYNIL